MAWEIDWEAHALVPGASGEASAQNDLDDQRRPVVAFDNGAGAANELIVTGTVKLSSSYAGGSLQADFQVSCASGANGDAAFDIFVEKTQVNADMKLANWGAANQEIVSGLAANGTNLRKDGQLTLSNLPAGGVAAGDLLRFKVQRNTDAAGDNLTGDAWLYGLKISEV